MTQTPTQIRRETSAQSSLPVTHEFGTGPALRDGRRKTFGHIILAMHFGFYLMIAALVIMGVEVIYALYQLANFFL